MPRLKNKIALVTGAARGIGAAIAKAFADEGADVIVTDILDAQGQAYADQIGAAYHRLDVARSEDWRAVLSARARSSIFSSTMPGSQGLNLVSLSMIQSMSRWTPGTRCMRSTWMAPCSAARPPSKP